MYLPRCVFLCDRHLCYALLRVAMLGVISQLPIIAAAQLAPIPPFLPTRSEQCATFAKQSDAFLSDMGKEHDACLADHKADQKETGGTLKCSRTACQHLHDFVYGAEQKLARDAIGDCYSQVSKVEKRASEKREQEATDNVKREQRKARYEAERKVRNERENDVERAEVQARIDDRAAVRQQHYEDQTRLAQHAELEKQIERERQEHLQTASSDALARLVDPDNTRTARGERSVTKDGGLVDPFTSDSSAEIKSRYEVSKDVLLASFENSEAAIDRDMQLAGRTLRGAQRSTYISESKELKDVFGGLRKLLIAADYSASAAAIFKSTDDVERSRSISDFATKLSLDVSQHGAKAVVTRLFPEAAAVLGGPVAWVATVGSETLASTETSRDFTESIRDKSGRVSVAEKRQALSRELQAYDKYGSGWVAAQQLELLENIRLMSSLPPPR